LALKQKGKDTDTLAKEIRRIWVETIAKEWGHRDERQRWSNDYERSEKARLTKAAKQLGIKTEGKSLDELAREVNETRIKQQAQKLGIHAEGKDIEQLAQEVRETLITRAAEQARCWNGRENIYKKSSTKLWWTMAKKHANLNSFHLKKKKFISIMDKIKETGLP